jgi:hypothetical protein
MEIEAGVIGMIALSADTVLTQEAMIDGGSAFSAWNFPER